MRNGISGAKQQGGASGAPTVVERAVVARHEAAKPGVPAPKGEAARPVKRYRVLNGGTIVWQNCRTALRAGKEVTDATYDIKLLKRQGIRLEPIEDDAEPVVEPQAANPGDIVVPGTEEARVSADAIAKEVADAKSAGRAPNDPTPRH